MSNYRKISLLILLPVLLSSSHAMTSSAQSNNPPVNIPIYGHATPSLDEKTSFTKCDGMTYALSAKVTELASNKSEFSNNLSAKVELVKESDLINLDTAVTAIEEHYNSISSLSGACLSLKQEEMSLSIRGYEKSSGKEKIMMIEVSTYGIKRLTFDGLDNFGFAL